jgi:hypothetical protein
MPRQSAWVCREPPIFGERERERERHAGPVGVEHLERLSKLAADLDDPEVISEAWS